MSNRRLTNYFEEALTVPANDEYILADIRAASVPLTLSALETRKGRSFWTDEIQWTLALNLINDTQVRLLMDATDRLINEVRAGRNGVDTPLEARDPRVDPYTLNLASLSLVASGVFETRDRLGPQGTDIDGRLQEILAAIQASGGSPEVLERLDTLIILLGAL